MPPRSAGRSALLRDTLPQPTLGSARKRDLKNVSWRPYIAVRTKIKRIAHMALAYTLPDRLPLWQRLLFAIPFIGRISKEVAYGETENFVYALITLVCLWGCSIVLFGIPGLYLPAVALVPVMFILLIAISRG